MKLISNVYESDVSLILQQSSGCTVHEPVHMYVCVCVFVGRVLGEICVGTWMTVISVWERGRRAILQRGKAKRVTSRNVVSRLSVIPFLSLSVCMLPRDKVN